ncbi:hypothetical protein BKA69DRAFT_1039657 [Paraphysoderma sedebokerense]|nr:hypothetical protein BKA69DRAFT_1039657 [Paraphysoderma sedebokerense]
MITNSSVLSILLVALSALSIVPAINCTPMSAFSFGAASNSMGKPLSIPFIGVRPSSFSASRMAVPTILSQRYNSNSQPIRLNYPIQSTLENSLARRTKMQNQPLAYISEISRQLLASSFSAAIGTGQNGGRIRCEQNNQKLASSFVSQVQTRGAPISFPQFLSPVDEIMQSIDTIAIDVPTKEIHHESTYEAQRELRNRWKSAKFNGNERGIMDFVLAQNL